MKKKMKLLHPLWMGCRKTFMIMRFTIIVVLISAFQVMAGNGYSQSVRLSFDLHNATVKKVLSTIEDQTEFYFLYNSEWIDVQRKVDVSVRNETIEHVLSRIFSDGSVNVVIRDRHILLNPAGKTDGVQQGVKTISGRVVDSFGSPLPGVSILVKGTTNGIVTDSDGNYSMRNIPDNATLIFSFIGMKTQEIPLEGKTNINVTMAEDAIGIEEVVAIGYGTVRKSDLTGSVAKVNVSNSIERSVTSVEEILQGQVSGVQITQNTGAPGAGITFSIRGATSINGSNQPLIIIDGYPVNTDNSSVKVNTNSGYGAVEQPTDNALANLNPGEIESVEILKDASAAAIYGSRASNGVVIITTKRGKAGEDRIEYSYRRDISNLPKQIHVLNTADYMAYANEASLNSGQDSIFNADQIEYYLAQGNTNWQDEVYQTAVSNEHQLNISGGKDKTRYALVVGYLNKAGIVKNSYFDRGSIRLNLDRELNNKLKIGLNMSAVLSKSKAPVQSSDRMDATTSVVMGALVSRPMDVPYTVDDEINQTFRNPMTLIDLVDDQNKVTSVLANLFIKYAITKDLEFKVNGGINLTDSKRNFWYPVGTSYGDQTNGAAYWAYGNSFNYLSEYTLNFNKSIKKHRINAVTGYTWQKWDYSSFSIVGTDFQNDNLTFYAFSAANSYERPTTRTQEWAMASFIGRANYSFDNRYLFTFTGRYDGSTRLAKGNKWDFFPSVALGWNMHNEKFMRSLEFISTLKIRGSYGISGNQNVSIGATKANLGTTTSVINNTIETAYKLGNMANSELKWEKTRQTDIGCDLEFLNSRIAFSFDYYHKRTEDLLIALTIPYSTGFGSYNTNAGTIENNGYEFDLSGKILTGKFRWDALVNLSINRNKIINLGGSESFVGMAFGAVGNQSMHIAKVGYPIGSFYGYRITGIYQNQEEVDAGPTDASATNEPGSFKYKDIGGPDGTPDGVINTYDREIIGNPYPDFIFGITNNLSWKNLSLSFLIQGSIGQDVINANRYYQDALCFGYTYNVRQEAWDNRWRGEGTSNKYPKATRSANIFSSRFTDFLVEDASFIRLKNVTLSYQLPVRRGIGPIRSIKLFVSAGNLLTWTNYSGYDPEINSKANYAMMPGVDSGSIPQYQTFSTGVNVKF
jgi:TonB-linked SusC/RagA family outer membrane protein